MDSIVLPFDPMNVYQLEGGIMEDTDPHLGPSVPKGYQ